MKQFDVPNFYKSELLSNIKERRKQEDKLKKDFTPTLVDYAITFFCNLLTSVPNFFNKWTSGIIFFY